MSVGAVGMSVEWQTGDIIFEPPARTQTAAAQNRKVSPEISVHSCGHYNAFNV
jgi:hypothetical protein